MQLAVIIIHQKKLEQQKLKYESYDCSSNTIFDVDFGKTNVYMKREKSQITIRKSKLLRRRIKTFKRKKNSLPI